eukprot:957833-Prymnesium_polylepis.1
MSDPLQRFVLLALGLAVQIFHLLGASKLADHVKETLFVSSVRDRRSERETPDVPAARPLCILSLDGGGMKGIVLVTVLEALQQRTSLPLSRLFDLIVGTSTGGVAALHLAHAMPPAS